MQHFKYFSFPPIFFPFVRHTRTQRQTSYSIDTLDINIKGKLVHKCTLLIMFIEQLRNNFIFLLTSRRTWCAWYCIRIGPCLVFEKVYIRGALVLLCLSQGYIFYHHLSIEHIARDKTKLGGRGFFLY